MQNPAKTGHSLSTFSQNEKEDLRNQIQNFKKCQTKSRLDISGCKGLA